MVKNSTLAIPLLGFWKEILVNRLWDSALNIMFLRLSSSLPGPVTNNMKLISSNYVHVSPNVDIQITVIMKADGTDSRNVS